LIKYRDTHTSPDTAATIAELARLKELEHENQELRAENLFLKSQLGFKSSRKHLRFRPL